MQPIKFPESWFADDEDTTLEDNSLSADDAVDESELDDSEADSEDEETPFDAELEGDEDSEDEEDDTEEEDAGDETDEDEDEEEDDEDDDDDSDEDEESEDDEDEESFLPPFDRKKFLEEHPELEAPYKHFQAAFTRKTQELATARGETEALRSQLTDFVQTLATDEGASEFLERVALTRPEVFQQVVERWEESLADDDVRESRVKEIKLKDREKELTRKEQLEAAKQQQLRVEEVVNLTETAAEEAGLTDEDSVAIAKKYVLAQIHENKARTGKAEVSDAEVVAAVKAAAKHVRTLAKKAEKTTQEKNRVEKNKKAKEKLKKAATPQPAKSKAKKPLARKPQVPKGMDPIHYKIQKGLGLID